MKKRFSVITILLIALVMITACNPEPKTRRATLEDVGVYLIHRGGTVKIITESEIYEANDSISVSGNSENLKIVLLKDIEINLQDYSGVTIVFKKGTTIDGEVTSTVDRVYSKGTLVVNGESYSVEYTGEYNPSTDGSIRRDFIINNELIDFSDYGL